MDKTSSGKAKPLEFTILHDVKFLTIGAGGLKLIFG
jgi:hypothetical protein